MPTLILCIEDLAPVPLVGLSLLRQPLGLTDAARGSWFPTDITAEQLVAAALDLIAYGDRCRESAHKLSDLHPIPVSFSVAEYPL